MIEKDAIAGKLAADLRSDELIILTDVEYVYKNFGLADQTPIETMDLQTARTFAQEGQFEVGTMLPKIEAAIAYLEKVPTGKVLITNQESIGEALKGKKGSVITA